MPFRVGKFKKIAAAALAASLILSGCANGGEVKVPDYAAVSGGYIEETSLSTLDSTRADWVKTNMQLMLSNESAELYLGPHFDIAVVDKRTGAVTFSNEAAYSADAENFSLDQQKNAFSQIVIDYYRKDGVAVTVHSFPECYDGEDKKQVEAEVIGDTLTLKYSFGTVMESRVIFQVMTAETYEKIEKMAEEAIEKKELSSSGWGRMKSCYNFVEYNDLSADEIKRYTETYPSFGKGDKIYVLNPSATYIQTDNIEEVCKNLGLTRADVDAEVEKMGGTGSLVSTIPNFVVELEYALDGADLLVTVDPQKIVEPANFYMEKLYVLPGFGATDRDEDGYLLIPDGTGSIVYNNAGSSAGDRYSLSFYGSDPAHNIKDRADLSSEAPFPIFALKGADNAVFGIVESGDALAGVTLQLANNNYPQNVLSPWFTYRVRGTLDDGSGTSTSKNYVYSQKIAAQPYTIRYHLLYGQRSNYSGMAAFYRSYLHSTASLSDTKSDFKVDVNLIGGVTAQKNILGISMTTAAAASDFDSIEKWLEGLPSNNVDLNIEGLFGKGIESSAPTKLKLVSALGSREKYDALCTRGRLFPALSFLQVANSGGGIKGNTDIVKFIDREFAFLAPYMPHTGLRSEEKSTYLLSPAVFGEVGKKLTSELKDFGDTLLLYDGADLLFSDFNENNKATREDAKFAIRSVLDSMKKQGLTLKLGGANVYALPYAAALCNVDLTSERDKIISEAIPFLGMVLHGSIAYSSAPLNEAGDYRSAVLDMVENGANPAFRLITGDMSLLADTEYTEFYGADASVWSDEINELCSALSTFYDATADCTVTDHELISRDLRRVTYSNGYTAVINRGTDTAQINGVTVEARSFKLFNADGEGLK